MHGADAKLDGMPALSAPQAFVEPRWSEALNVANYIAGAPTTASVKGMFFSCITRLAGERGGAQLGRDHYTAFKSYPLEEWLKLLPECAAHAYPRLPLRAALFETGSHIYGTFAQSTVGRVVMSVAGRDVHAALRLVTRAYDAVGSHASVKLLELEQRRAVVAMRNNWEFADCYQAGIIAAGVKHYGENPKVRVRRHAPQDVDIELIW